MWPSLSRNLTRLFDVCSPHHPREHMTFEESVYLRFTKRRSKRLEAPLAARNAARNHSISGGAAFLHEFRIVLFLRSSRLYICTTPPCHVNYSWSDQELLVRGRSRVSPVARSTLTCITPCRITLGFRHVERVHTCLRTVICVRVGVTQPRCPHEAAPLIHRARGSSLIEERATVMWNMITHEQIIRVITIALAGQQPARRLQGIWFYLWTMDHGVRAGCPFASLMLVDRFGSEIPGIGGRGFGRNLGGSRTFERLNLEGTRLGDLQVLISVSEGLCVKDEGLEWWIFGFEDGMCERRVSYFWWVT